MYDVEKWQETHSIKSIMQWVMRGAPTPLSEPMIIAFSALSNEETKPITSLIDELGGINDDNTIREIMSIIKIYSELTKEEQDRQLS